MNFRWSRDREHEP